MARWLGEFHDVCVCGHDSVGRKALPTPLEWEPCVKCGSKDTDLKRGYYAVIDDLSKVLFLDIDGVLCLNGVHIDRQCAQNLCDILEATGCAIVLSSTWRLHTHYKDELRRACSQDVPTSWIDAIVSITPYQPVSVGSIMSNRSSEILEWLHHWDVDRYAVVDDEPIAAYRFTAHPLYFEPRPRFCNILNLACIVQTKFEMGLTESAKHRLIDILGMKP